MPRMNVVLDIAHKGAVLGLVGLTATGISCIYSGLGEVREQRKAIEAETARRESEASKRGTQ